MSIAHNFHKNAVIIFDEFRVQFISLLLAYQNVCISATGTAEQCVCVCVEITKKYFSRPTLCHIWKYFKCINCSSQRIYVIVVQIFQILLRQYRTNKLIYPWKVQQQWQIYKIAATKCQIILVWWIWRAFFFRKDISPAVQK